VAEHREVAVVQEIWAKFNANERLAAIGAILIVVGWLVALVSFGFGSNFLALLGAIAVLAILWLKYSPSSNVTWPAPVPVILLAISGVVGLIELLDLLQLLRVLGFAGGLLGSFFGGGYILALILTIVGAAVMLYGSYQDWNASKRVA
jgi:hypothetical protein